MVGNEAWRSQVQEWIQQDYPNLADENYQITSPDTIDYNCVAWALEETQRWWWPDSFFESYWPPNIPREETIEAFQKLFQYFGYSICDAAILERDVNKIAIYLANNKPTHVARQLENGKWTSKLGSNEDIEHDTLEGLEGKKYGKVVCIMKRPKN